jgi:superfamily II DNA or RNA helicase
MTVQLRPYQRDSIDAIYGYFARASGHPLIVIPTAGGKSLVLACRRRCKDAPREVTG